MKKILPGLVLISLLVMPAMALAAEDDDGGTFGGSTPNGGQQEIVSTGQDIITLIDNIADWIFVILLSVAAIFLIISGFLWVTAGGSPEQTTKARQMLINALIGVAIALGAKGLVLVLKDILGYTS